MKFSYVKISYNINYLRLFVSLDVENSANYGKVIFS